MQSTTEPLKILVVDDDRDAVSLCQAAIRNHFKKEAVTYVSTSASDALSCLESQETDLVITDLDMSDLNGFHLLKSIKTSDPMVQIIITTAHDSPNAIRSAISLGVDDFFLKPYQPHQLIASILHLCEKRERWKASGLLTPIATLSEK